MQRHARMKFDFNLVSAKSTSTKWKIGRKLADHSLRQSAAMVYRPMQIRKVHKLLRKLLHTHNLWNDLKQSVCRSSLQCFWSSMICVTARPQALLWLLRMDMILPTLTTISSPMWKLLHKGRLLYCCLAQLSSTYFLSVRNLPTFTMPLKYSSCNTVKYLPAWLPGMSFKREALRHVGEMVITVEAPFSFTKGEIVRQPLILDRLSNDI